jgi:hypothetical protein
MEIRKTQQEIENAAGIIDRRNCKNIQNSKNHEI